MVLLIPFSPIVVGGAFLGTIAISTISNIQQTINVRKEFEFKQTFVAKYHDDESSILSCYLQPNKDGLLQASVPIDKTSCEVLQDLKHMKRNEVIALFLSCPSPTELKQIQGEWDGTLLENNGLVMNNVATLITNMWFGRGQKWNGKAFLGAKSEDSSSSSYGINRFQTDNKSIDSGITTNHNFDYSLTESVFGNQSIRLKYAKYQSLLSPWKSMNDEVRMLKMPSSGSTVEDGGIFIGLGWMAWSGGCLNCSPFCLTQSSSRSKKNS